MCVCEEGGGVIWPRAGFLLITQKMVKARTLVFAACNSFLLETLVPNLISLTRPSLQILGKISNFWIYGQFFVNENCHNCRTSHDIDIESRPVSKIDKRNTVTSKKLTMMSCWQIVTSLFFSGLWPICSHPETGFWTHGL